MRLFDNGDVALDKWTAVRSLALLHLSVLVSAGSPREKFIKYGERIQIETMPHTVAILLVYEWPKFLRICSGSIVTHRWVLSAAHCGTMEKPKADLFKIRFGMDTYSQEGPVSDVKKRVCHPRSKWDFGDADICLLQTFDEIPFSDRVQPVLIPRSSEAVTQVRVAGWGMNRHLDYPPYLSAIDLPIISDAECDGYLGGDLAAEEPGTFFCAGKDGDRKSKTPYYGDSGSGAVIRSSDNKSWIALGVTSWGTGNGATVFISVPNYANWIRKTLNKYS